MQGWRKLMQDAIVCQQISPGIQLYGVFDGHGRPEVALYVSRILPKELVVQPNFKQKNFSKALTNTFKKIDEMLKSPKAKNNSEKYINNSNYLKNKTYSCTANVVLLTKQKIIVANIGDSRSVLCRKDSAIPLSDDHKPQNPIEKQRINSSGDYIKNGRINGRVNLSRAFGDFQYKSITSKKYDQQPVISVPDIKQVNRTHEDSFIVIGCDGIWQRFVDNNQKMIDCMKQFKNKYKDKKSFVENFVHSLLAKNTKQLQGLDNMSIIVLDFV